MRRCTSIPRPTGGRGFWVLTKFDDVRAVLQGLHDLLLGGRRGGADRGPAGGRARRAAQLPRVRPAQARPLPPPLLRRFHAVRRGALGGLAARARARAPGLRRCPQGEFDLVAELAAPIPIRVLGHILGLPEEQLPRLIELGDRLLVDTEPEYVGDLAFAGEQDEYRYKPFGSPWAEELCALGREQYAERRACPRDDVLSLIANGTVDGRPLDAAELDNMFALMVVAGNETTRQAIALSTLALARRPEDYARLRARPELIGAAGRGAAALLPAGVVLPPHGDRPHGDARRADRAPATR